MRRFFSILLFCFIYLASCSTSKLAKLKPQYEGVDPKFITYVNEYINLAALKNIKFNKVVSIGFKHINLGNIIGVCHYGLRFREIDIDTDYFNKHSAIVRTALLFHELTHCYCYRDHDFNDGETYPDQNIITYVVQWMSIKKRGYMEDGCPLSLMHPIILDEACINRHYDYYIEEMFNRCIPY